MDLRQRKKSVVLAHQDKFNLVGGCSTHVVSIKQGSAMASKAPERTKTGGGADGRSASVREKKGSAELHVLRRTSSSENFLEAACAIKSTPHMKMLKAR
jgi:hypothetical protein